MAHLFSSHDKTVIRGWITALLKLKIDYSFESEYLLSSRNLILHNGPTHSHAEPTAFPANIPVIPLAVAQAMVPAPRPPSPTSQVTAQRASRRPQSINHYTYPRTRAFFKGLQAEGPASPCTGSRLQAPVRPPRDVRRNSPKPEVRSSTPSI